MAVWRTPRTALYCAHMSLTLRGGQQQHSDDFVLFPEAGPHGEIATEGRLAIDVHESEKEIIVRSPIAGVRPEDVEVSVHGDMLTIRGRRHEDVELSTRPLVRECHWGAFSRSVILPAEVDAERIGATLKDGVLAVRLPKTGRPRKIDVKKV